MDEIDNEALSVLMILDDELFPQMLEWSASKGWSDLVIFLLETDYLRFKTNDMFESEPDKTGLYEPYHLIQKNSGGCFDQFFTTQQMDSLKRLIDSGIPLNSVYSQVCTTVWKEMLLRTSEIMNSPTWPTVRRSIVEHHEIGIEDMLGDDMKRKYFDRYIQGDACDLAALQCLLSVRRIFAALSQYKEVHLGEGIAQEYGAGTTGSSTNSSSTNTTASSGMFSYFGSKNGDENASIMRRWKASKNAIVSASKALQAPFAASSHPAGANNSSTQGSTHHEYYTDPFEAFKILLEGTRQLQKQFFPASTNLTSPGSAFNAHSNGTSPRSTHYTDTMSDSTISPPGQSHSGRGSVGSGRMSLPHANTHGQARNCSGISEALRMEIQSTLTVNASVRSREIETVDRAFAFACAHMLDKQLHALETEMLTYISAIFVEFQHTHDYALMVAQTRALQCKRITDYSSKLEFLYDRVRQQKIVSWKDSNTRGKVFIAYDRVAIEGEDTSTGDSESKASPEPFPMPFSPFSPLSAVTPSSTGSGGSPRVVGSGAGSSPRVGTNDSANGSANGELGGTAGGVTAYAAQELDRQGRFNPNVVAISLEIVVPHTTMLTPSNVASCSHRVSLYAGGKRRAARLRAAVPSSPVPAAEPSMLSPQAAPTSVMTAASKLNVRSFIGNMLGAPSESAAGDSTGAGLSITVPGAASEGKSVDVYAASSPVSPTKSPMRRVGSVQFRLTEDKITEEGVPPGRSTTQSTPEHVSVPVVESIESDLEFRRADRSSSLDSAAELDGDTLSELPSMGIAGSIKVRNITNINDIGTGGNNIFNDIVNSGPNSSSGKFSLGGSFFEEDLSSQQGDENNDNSSEGSLSDANSDSSSDYEGDVRHVFSTTDLDQLIRMGDGSSRGDLAPTSIESPRGGTGGYRSGSRVPSMRNFSRVGSNASIQTGVTALTRHASGVQSSSYDTGVRKVVAVDLSKLDRTLHRDVLGTTRALPPNTANSTKGPPTGSSKAQQIAKTLQTRQLVASLAVALAGVFCDQDGFGRKFTAPVEESFTFTTDTKGLALLNDLVFAKQAMFVGPERTESYTQAFEKATSVFRQNSMLDTARPVYRVCVQVQSEVITPTRAAAVKLQLGQLNQLMSKSSASTGASTPGRSAPLHPSHGAHTVASRIPHSHVRIGVSYAQLTPQHAMLSTLSSIAFVACDVMVSGSAGSHAAGSSDTIGEEEKKSAEPTPAAAGVEQELVALPLKLRYTDNFVEYIVPPAPKPHPSCAPKESIYEMYLGTLPPLNDDGTQAYLRGATLCEPITRHVGLCDFSLSEVVTSLSTRLMLQILMLVLVDRPVLLISTSSTLLSKVQAAIPRLIWPFRIEGTHVVRQILSSAELHHFVYRHDVPFVSETQQPVIRDKKLNRKTSSWREMITRFASNVGLSPGGHSANDIPSGLRSPRGSFTRQRKSSSSGDLVAGMLKRPGSATGSVHGSDDGNFQSGTNSPIGLNLEPPSPGPENKTYQRILTPPSLQLQVPAYGSENEDEGPPEMQVDQHSCILGVDASAFYNAPAELRDELEAMRIRGSGFTFIDIDLGIILNRRPDEFCEEDEAPPKPLPSRLSDPEIFRCSNFGIYRSLVKTLNQVQAHLLKATRALLCPTAEEEEESELLDAEYMSSRLAEKVVLTNREVEKAFYAFWSEMVLRALPKNIQHFPGPKVISCDIRAVLTELLHTVVASSASMDMGEDVEDMYLASGESDSPRKRSLSIRSTSTTSEASVNPATSAVDANTAHYFSKQLPSALPDSAMFDNMNKLPFEEFLALFVEQVANHGETNMCYAFYKEFIADGSVVFKDLLTRHSAVLDRWSM